MAAEASETTATRFLEGIEDQFRLLQHSPMIGVGRNLLGAGLRALFHGNYAIYYLASADDLVVVRVLHGARDVSAIAERGGFLDLGRARREGS